MVTLPNLYGNYAHELNLFMRMITIASCAMFVSSLFKITEPKIVYSIK